MAAVVAFAFTTEAQTRKGTILLGAGSDLTDTEWTDLKITPKVGFFVQDGVAIGAIVNFNNRKQDEKDPTDAQTQVSLASSNTTLGAFVRYYVSNNVFAELEVANSTSKEDQYDYITAFRPRLDANGNQVLDASGNPIIDKNNQKEVFDLTTNSTSFGLGLGYTIVFKEHFALEPYVKLNLVSGDQQTYDRDLDPTVSDVSDSAHDYSLSTQNFTETNFNLGVNFSLFF
ncbi:MAG: hypothetical protein ACPGSD_04065 [Flavobacteriales bacterium]